MHPPEALLAGEGRASAGMTGGGGVRRAVRSTQMTAPTMRVVAATMAVSAAPALRG
jgi:hypothetical protein